MSGRQTRQQGAAHLLMVMAISMSITLVTLAVAKTQLGERQLSANSQWHTRLSLAARSAWHQQVSTLTDNPDTTEWLAGDSDPTVTFRTTTAENGIRTVVTLTRYDSHHRLIDIQAAAYPENDSVQQAVYQQSVRILSILTPAAESPPPLVLNGCLSLGAGLPAIHPKAGDTDQAGDAAWLFGENPCPAPDQMNTRKGAVKNKPLRYKTLWPILFTVDREQFSALAAADRALPAGQRRYWQAGPEDFIDGKWTLSLGHLAKPVAIYFPAEGGCPRFADGVQIFGVIYIDTDCSAGLSDNLLQITGLLAIDGNLNAGYSDTRLYHTQVIDKNIDYLNFPALHRIPVTGSWRDF